MVGSMPREIPLKGLIPPLNPHYLSVPRSEKAKKRRYFEGVIDEVAVYNRALSVTEVKKNKSIKGLAIKPRGKLALVWGDVKLDG